ncbi:ATP-binding cassette domain-containing protein [Bacillus mangrovi]|uniref:ATP-binding cassette domain-containing protein n=1 Tax=Metabacillus mangrovi TaxID=1491830 RepID=A0A7X2S7Q4_9BACI|nr:ATP-binding cassette domain-containing protein [Metabacillus mangrovi]MTH54731.1 ATP-binding cassette domain-containing protein [Metabacillus mangrovi]
MIALRNVRKHFSKFEAVKSVSLTIIEGEIHGIIGASGAGKSTLLRLMNLLEAPDEGDVEVSGKNLTAMSSRELREARKSIGMIFQHFNLAANKTVYGNVAAALELARYPKKDRRERVLECLRFVGLEKLADQYPARLSGGQKQRVAIARALANQPQVLLCDEPASALDPGTTADLLKVLESINQRFGVTIVIVSHEMEVIKSICQRITIMEDGKIYETVDRQPDGVAVITKSARYFADELKKAGDPGHA